MRPLLLQDGDEDEVEFVQEGALGAAAVFVVGQLDDKVDDEISDAWLSQSATFGRRNIYAIP